MMPVFNKERKASAIANHLGNRGNVTPRDINDNQSVVSEDKISDEKMDSILNFHLNFLKIDDKQESLKIAELMFLESGVID